MQRDNKKTMTVTCGYSRQLLPIFSKKIDMELAAMRQANAGKISADSTAYGDLSLQVKRIDAVIRPGKRITPDLPGQLHLLKSAAGPGYKLAAFAFASLLVNCGYTYG
jgi:hypothetical protein